MAQTPEEKRHVAKRHRLWVLYRITPEEQDVIEKFQRDSSVFRILLTKGDPKEEANLYIDHNHVSGKIRGRLAYLINKGLGVIEGTYKERTPEVLRALAYYLENDPATAVLGEPRYGMIGRAKINKKTKIYGSETGPIKLTKKESK